MKKRMKKCGIFLAVMTLLLTIFSVHEGIHAESGLVNVVLNGSVKLVNREWNAEDAFHILCYDESGTIVGEDTAVKDDHDFIINLQLEAGSTYNYKIKQEIPKNKMGIQYRANIENVQIRVNDDKTVEASVDGKAVSVNENNVINVNQQNAVPAFYNSYKTDFSYSIKGRVEVEGRDWGGNEVFDIDFFDVEYNNVKITGHSLRNAQDPLNTYRIGVSFNVLHAIPDGRVIHYIVRQSNKKVNSMILDTKEYDVYIKPVDNQKGNCTMYMSLDGVNYEKMSTMNALVFKNIYFAREVFIKNEKNTNAAYDLYRYHEGNAAMDNAQKEYLETIKLTNGTYTKKMEEGKYFLVEKESGALYSFDVTKDNYTTPYQIEVKGSPIASIAPHDTTPTNVENKEKKDNASTVPQTGDHTMLMPYMSLLVTSMLLGGIVLLKKNRQRN